MEVLVLDGKNYVKASKAARDLGYATDYVGQLCRSGQVDSHLIGRTWYVNQDDLGTHRVEKKRMSRTKAREQAKKLIEEYRSGAAKSQNNYTNIAIQYEHDSAELIPKPRVVPIESEPVSRAIPESTDIDADDMQVYNEGDKVLMSGDLNVVDVTDGVIDSDTVLLRPGRIRHGQIDAPPEAAAESIAEKRVERTARIKPSFEERLGYNSTAASISSTATQNQSELNAVVQETPPAITIAGSRPSIALCALALIAVLFATVASIPAYSVMKVSNSGVVIVESSLEYSTQEALEILSSKI